MDIDEVKKKIRGPMIPVITSLNKDLSIDTSAIKEEVNFLIEHGIKEGQGVLLAAGAGGDFNMLSLDERNWYVEPLLRHQKVGFQCWLEHRTPTSTI